MTDDYYAQLPPPSSDPKRRANLSVINELEPNEEVMIGRAIYYVTEMRVDEHGNHHMTFTPRDTASPPPLPPGMPAIEEWLD